MLKTSCFNCELTKQPHFNLVIFIPLCDRHFHLASMLWKLIEFMPDS